MRSSEAEKGASVMGKMDCPMFAFAADEDARVFAEVERSLDTLQSTPTVETLAAAQRRLMELAGYPTVVAVVAGRFPLLFTGLARFEKDLDVFPAEAMHVAGVKWDVWCRNTWLANACAVEDVGEVALSTLAFLPALLRSLLNGTDQNMDEVWSVLHVLTWSLRCSSMGGAVATLLESSDDLWSLIDTEVLKAGRHVGLQLVLLDLLSALALHVAFSSALHARILALVAPLTLLPLPVHFHTAVKLFYACAVAEHENEGMMKVVAHAAQPLRDAWDRMTQHSTAVPPAMQGLEWIAGPDVEDYIRMAARLHRLLRSSCNGAALDTKSVTAFNKTASEIPAAARAFCVYGLPGNPLLCLHRALANSVKAPLVVAITEALADMLLCEPDEKTDSEATGVERRQVGKSTYAQLSLQQLWVSGLGMSLSTLLNRRDSVVTAAVIHLLEYIALRTTLEGSARRVLLGTPSLSLVADILAGIAESDEAKEELNKKAVKAVVEHAFRLLCALQRSELTSVFDDSIVHSTSTLISEGKDVPVVLECGLRALAHLSSAFPMAASMALDFDFIAEQSAIADPPTAHIGALIVGSLHVMSAIVDERSAAVTFEWIECVLSIVKNLSAWRETVTGLDAALWRAILHFVEASEDCHEYLCTEEMQEALCAELRFMKRRDAHLPEVLPAVLQITVSMRCTLPPHAYVEAVQAVASVPATQWTNDMCESALRFLASHYQVEDDGDADTRATNKGKAAEEGLVKLERKQVVDAVLHVVRGSAHSNLNVRPSCWDDAIRALVARGLAKDLVPPLMELVQDAVSGFSEGPVPQPGAQQSLEVGLFVMHRLFVETPAAYTAGDAEAVQRLFCTLVDTIRPTPPAAVLEATLSLMDDTASAIHAEDAKVFAKDNSFMNRLWRSFSVAVQYAAEHQKEARWSAVAAQTYTAAHRVFLALASVPIAPQSDPRMRFVGECGLPHLSTVECAGFVQSILTDDAVRAYLLRDYDAPYTAALAYLNDPAHHVTGQVPLSLQQYVEETKLK